MKTATTTIAPASETIMPIQTKHLAKQFGIKATTLRRVLRSMPEYADGVHTIYRWSENDKRIPSIKAQIDKLAKDKSERAIAAKKALDARAAAVKKQAEVDAKVGVKA